MKKILAIIGSSKGKGNTWKATEQVREKMQELGDVNFEYLLLKDADIKMCRGCSICSKKGEDLCPLKDDVKSIKQKILEADGIIFASPVYSMNVTALMKNFIDRVSYLFHRPELFGKKALALVTTRVDGLKPVIGYLSKLEGWGFEKMFKVGTMTMPVLSSKILEDQKKKVDKVATQFYKALNNNQVKKPSFKKLLYFRIFRSLPGLTEATRNYYAKDFEYYIQFINKEYYYDCNVSFIKRMLVSISEKALSFFMKGMFRKV